MRTLRAVLFLTVCVGLHAAEVEVRVQVGVFGEPQLAKQTERELKRAFEAIDGVITVNKQPDVVVSVVASSFKLGGAELVTLAGTANVTIPDGAAVALLRGEATRAGIDNLQKLLNALVIIGIPYSTAGTRDSLTRLCSEVAAAIDKTAIENVRKYPNDRDSDIAAKSFFGRIGAKPVIASPAQKKR